MDIGNLTKKRKMNKLEQRTTEYCTNAWGELDSDKWGPFKHGYEASMSDIRAEVERMLESAKESCQKAQEQNDRESYIAWSESVATCGKIIIYINGLSK